MHIIQGMQGVSRVCTAITKQEHRMYNTYHTWTKNMLLHLHSRNIGWAKNMKTKLEVDELESDWEVIKQMPKPQLWKRLVEERRNGHEFIQNSIKQLYQLSATSN